MDNKVIADVVITGLNASKQYKWQARVKDEAGALSACWVNTEIT